MTESGKRFVVNWTTRDVGQFKRFAEQVARLAPYGEVLVDLSALADKALRHAIRRYCGENLPVTQNDLLGTIALITQLMADVEIALVVDKLADAIVEECDGSPPDAVFEGIRSLVLRTIRNTDLLNSRSYRTLH